jgi:hypothetical protein
MAKIDRYSVTSKSTAEQIKANALAPEVVDRINSAVDLDPSTNPDAALIYGLNPNMTAEELYLTNEQNKEVYNKQLQKDVDFTTRATQVGMAALDYAPNVVKNLIGYSIGVGGNKFETSGEALEGFANVFGSGTSLGQVVGQSFNNVFAGGQYELGTDIFVDEKATAEARAQLYGWDSVDEFGRPSVGSQVAGNLVGLSPDSAEFKTIENFTNLAMLPVEFATIGGVFKAATLPLKATQVFKGAGRAAEVAGAGKKMSEAEEALVKLNTEKEAAEAAFRAKFGDNALDTLSDVPEAGEEFLKGADVIKQTQEAEGLTTSVQKNLDTIAHYVDPSIKESQILGKINGKLENGKITNEQAIAQASAARGETIAYVDNVLESARLKLAEQTGNPDVTIDDVAKFIEEQVPNLPSYDPTTQKLVTDFIDAYNRKKVLDAENSTVVVKEGKVEILSDIDKAKVAEEVATPEAPKVYDSQYETMDIKEIEVEARRQYSSIPKENISPTILLELAKSTSKVTARNVAKNANITIDVVRQLLSKKKVDKEVLENIVKNPNTPTEILEELYRSLPEITSGKTTYISDTTSRIRKQILDNPNISQDTLIRVANDINSSNRRQALQNPNLPESELIKLSKDNDEDVLWSILSNPSSPTEAIENAFNTIRKNKDLKLENAKSTLSDEAYNSLKENDELLKDLYGVLSSKKNAPEEILKEAYDAAKKLDINEEKLGGWPTAKEASDASFKKTVLINLAENESTPASILDDLAKNAKEGSNVEMTLASNPALSEKSLKLLSKSKWASTKANIAKNPSTPSESLAKLADDKDSFVRIAAAKNPSTPSESLAKLANDNNNGIKRAVAANPNTPSESLVKLIDNADEDIRTAAYYNPNIDDAVRKGRVELLEVMPSSMAKDSNLSIKISDEAEAAFQAARAKLNAPAPAVKAVDEADTVVRQYDVNPAVASNYKAIEDIGRDQETIASLRVSIDETARKVVEDYAAKFGIDIKTLGKTYEDSAQFLKEYAGLGRGLNDEPLVNLDRFIKYMLGGKADYIINMILKINQASETLVKNGKEARNIGQLFSILEKVIDTEFIIRLSKATTADEIKSVFILALAKGGHHASLTRKFMLRQQARIIDAGTGEIRTLGEVDNIFQKAMEVLDIQGGRFLLWGLDKTNRLLPTQKAYDITNAEQMIQGIVDLMDYYAGALRLTKIGKEGEAVRALRDEAVTKMANATSPEARREVFRVYLEKQMILLMRGENLTKAEQKEIMDLYKKAEVDVEEYRQKLAVNNFDNRSKILDGLLSNDEKSLLSTSGAYEMHLSNTVHIVDPFAMRAAIRKNRAAAKTIKENVKRGIVTPKESTGLLADLLGSYDKVFKRAVLARFGYVIRNVIDTQIRMFLKGHPSALTNPFFIIGRLVSGDVAYANRMFKYLEKHANNRDADSILNRLIPGSLDIKGNPIGRATAEMQAVSKLNDEIEIVNKKINSLNTKLANATTDEAKLAIQKQLDIAHGEADKLYADLETIVNQAEFDQMQLDIYRETSNSFDITNPGDGNIRTSLLNRNRKITVDDVGYGRIDILNAKFEEYLTAIVHFALRISSDKIAMDVLHVLSGRGLPKEIAKFAKEADILDLPLKDIVVKYYWSGPGRAKVNDMVKSGRGANAEKWNSEQALRAHLFGAEQEGIVSSYATILRNFTGNFDSKLVDFILYGKITRIDANGKEVLVKFPENANDVDATVTENYLRRVAEGKELYKDLVTGWKARIQEVAVKRNNGEDVSKINTDDVVTMVPKVDIDFEKQGWSWNDVWEFFTDKPFEWSAKAEKTFAWMPEFKFSYWDYIAKMISAVSAKEAAVIISNAEKSLRLVPGFRLQGNWAAKTLRDIKKNAKYSPEESFYTADDLGLAATKSAAREVKQLFFDASKRNAFAHMFRFQTTFLQAHANSISVVSKLIVRKPEQLAKFGVLYQYFNSESSSWINDLFNIPEGDPNQPFMYKDNNNQTVMGIPVIGPGLSMLYSAILTSGLAINGITGVTAGNFNNTLNVSSLNTVTQGGVIPTGGPLIQIGLTTLRSFMPNVYELIPETIRTQMAPYLSQEGTPLSLESTLFPAWLKSILAPLMFPDRLHAFHGTAISLLTSNNPERYFNEGGELDSNKLNLLMNEAAIVTGFLSIAKGIIQFFAPAQTNVDAIFTSEDAATYPKMMLSAEYYELMSSGSNQGEAINKMVKEYGFPVVFSLLSSTASTFTPTSEAYDVIKNNPKLMDTDGETLSFYFINGGFDKGFAALLNNKTRLSMEEMLKTGNQMLKLAQLGNLDQQFMDGKITLEQYEQGEKVVRAKFEKVPIPATENNYFPKYYAELQEGLKVPEIAATEAGQAFAIYNEVRNSFIVEQNGVDEFGAKKNQGRRMALYSLGIQLANQYPDFNRMWYRFLQSEVKPKEGAM